MSLQNVLFEDEDDIFTGSPKSKFFDIIFGVGNGDLSKQVIEDMVQRLAILELMLSNNGDKDIENDIKTFLYQNRNIVDDKTKSLFIEYAGEVLIRTDS